MLQREYIKWNSATHSWKKKDLRELIRMLCAKKKCQNFPDLNQFSWQNWKSFNTQKLFHCFEARKT